MSSYRTALMLEDLPPPETDRFGWPWTEQAPPLPERMANGCQWPRISIVTPSYNQGKFLEETIRSVLLQGYPNLEYIVIDGGSTDNSVEIIQRYQQYLNYWVSEADKGPTDAINKGWNRATGEIVAYLNSDDVYLPGTLTTIASVFQGNSSASVVCGNELTINSEGIVITQSNIGKIDHQSLMSLNFIPQPATFIRRDALAAVGALDTEVKYIFDFELWLRLTRAGSVKSISNILAATRWHDATITVTRRLDIGRELAKLVTREVTQFSPELSSLDKRKLLFNLNIFVISLHFEKNQFIQSIRYGWPTFYVAPNLRLKASLIKVYLRYFKSQIEQLLGFRSSAENSPSESIGYHQVHWSKTVKLQQSKI